MVKFHESTFSHPHPFETVTLAYFLRYPNPYSTHVLSTDVVSRYFDPLTQTLYTARLHLKRSKIPSAILKLIPKSWLGASDGGTSQSYILERSIVGIKDGIMVTESQNLEFTGVLKVLERQLYRRPSCGLGEGFQEKYGSLKATQDRPGVFQLVTPHWAPLRRREGLDHEETEVSTKVELISRLGDSPRRKLWSRMRNVERDVEGEPHIPKMGLFRSWSTSSVQRSIEAIGLRRTERAVPNSKKGMNIVLDRLRNGGLVAVLEGMKSDREEVDIALRG